MDPDVMEVSCATEELSALQRKQLGRRDTMSLAPLPAIRNDKENAAVKRHSSLSTDESTIPGRVLRCADTNVCQETQFSHVEKPTLAYGVEAKGQPLARRVDPATDGGGDTATTTTTVHQGRRRKHRNTSTASAGDNAMLRGMWDSVVSMMKTAVDALLFDDDSVEVGVDVSAPEPPAKRRNASESGMQLKTNRVRNSVQRVESMGAKSSINVQKPKIKEAKKLNPNARKRRVVRQQSFTSRQMMATCPTAWDKDSEVSPPPSKLSGPELNVFSFRSSPLSKTVADTVGTSPYSRKQVQRSGFAEGSSPSLQKGAGHCKRLPRVSASSCIRIPAFSPNQLQVSSPLTSTVFSYDHTQGGSRSQVLLNSADDAERHVECTGAGRSEPSLKASSRPSSRAGLSRAKTFFLRNTSSMNSGGHDSSFNGENESGDVPCLDPLLKKKVIKSAMPVRAAKRLKPSTSSGSPAKKRKHDDAAFECLSAPCEAEAPTITVVEAPNLPPPPPPPPPPLAPGTPVGPPVPPPPPGGGTPIPLETGTAATGMAGRMLAGMQKRLRSRMRQGATNDAPKNSTKDSTGHGSDAKLSQWAAIQSKFRKMSIEEFLQLAAKHRMETVSSIRTLARETPTDIVEMINAVEALSAATCWWPGGCKEMKETIPEWKGVELKLETMAEYIKVVHSMKEMVSTVDTPQAEFHLEVSRLREAFMTWHRNWSSVLLANASSWRELHLPVDDSLLNQARCFLAETMMLMANRVCEETASLNGCSIAKSHRLAKQLTALLQECIELLTTALDIVKLDAKVAGHEGASDAGLLSHCAAIKSAAVLCTQRYVELKNAQYLAFVCKNPKQEVTAHFDGVLKALGLLKTLARHSMDSSRPWSELARKGVLYHFTCTKDLSNSIYKSCVNVLQHIMQASNAMQHEATAESCDQSSREMMLWLMFGCKFLNRCLEMLGEDCEVHVKELLASLQEIEDNLPTF